MIQERAAELKAENQHWATERKSLQEKKDEEKIAQGVMLTKADWSSKVCPLLLTSSRRSANLHSQLRDARDSHLATLLSIEVHYNPLLQVQKLRYSPLGEDDEGRIYHVLSNPLPNAYYSTYEAAPGKAKSKRRPPKSLAGQVKQAPADNWAYFVFVWGRKPVEAVALPGPKREGDDIDNDEDSAEEADESADEERWWCFKDAKDIRDLAKWLESKAVAKDRALAPPPEMSSFVTVLPLSLATASPAVPVPPPVPQNASIAPNAPTRVKTSPPTPNANRIRPLVSSLKSFADFLDSRFGKNN